MRTMRRVSTSLSRSAPVASRRGVSVSASSTIRGFGSQGKLFRDDDQSAPVPLDSDSDAERSLIPPAYNGDDDS